MTKPKITIGAVDVTEEVAAMYDAIVGSIDWGSDFLDADQIKAILRIGVLADFNVPDPSPGTLGFEPPMRKALPLDASYATRWADDAAYVEKHKAAVEKWRAQLKAAAAAERGDA